MRWVVLWLAMMGAAMADEPKVVWPINPNWRDGMTDSVPILPMGPFSPDTWLTFTAAGVSLGPHGEVRLDGKHDLDTTAKLFWNAVARVRGQALPFPEVEP